MEEIMVSICCLVYNHEKYLRQCLDGFISQKCNFKYEVLIHDDASTDRSPEIIREYENRYPDIIKPIYQTENQYSKGIRISNTYQYPRAKGKYIALCEGDDYWTDCNKLQKQYDILEQNQECHLCVHRVRMIEEDGTETKRYCPSLDIAEGIYDSERFIELVCCSYKLFHTCSYFFKTSDIRYYISGNVPFAQLGKSGDYNLLLFFGQLGKVYYSIDVMSHYRMNSISSWSLRLANSSKEDRNKYDAMFYEMQDAFDKYTNYRYAKFSKQRYVFKEFDRASKDRNYRKMISKKYRIFFSQLTLKERIKTKAYVIIPRIMQLYDRRKGN